MNASGIPTVQLSTPGGQELSGASGTEPSRWKTIVVDAFGFAAVIWSIPIAILLISTPLVLVVALILMAIRSIFGP